MQRSEQLNELFAAMSKLHGEVNNAYKDKKGHGYNYADLGQVIEITKDKLKEYGLSIMQCPTTMYVIEFDEQIDGKTEKEGILNFQVKNKTYGTVTDKMIVPVRKPVQKLWTEIQHSSGQWIAFEMDIIIEKGAGMSWAQSIGSVITYARRYSRSGVTGITQTDNDASLETEITVQNKIATDKVLPKENHVPMSDFHIKEIRELIERTATNEELFIDVAISNLKVKPIGDKKLENMPDAAFDGMKKLLERKEQNMSTHN